MKLITYTEAVQAFSMLADKQRNENQTYAENQAESTVCRQAQGEQVYIRGHNRAKRQKRSGAIKSRLHTKACWYDPLANRAAARFYF